MTLHRNCDGLHRRDCLRFGLHGLLGGAISPLLGATARGAAAETTTVRRQAESCILIWLDGGPTHYETFDPKPDAPVEIRGEFETIGTKLPGVFFSKHMTRLAEVADKISVIRSIRHDQGNHGAGNHYMMTGAPPRIPVGCGAFVSFHPSLGSTVAHQRKTADGLPAYFSMPQMSRSGGPNFLGAQYAPFVVSDNPNSSSFRVRDVSLPIGIDSARFTRRRQWRSELDRLQRIEDDAAGDPARALDKFYDQAQQIILSSQAQEAFAIEKEAGATRTAYGRHPFGQRALLARRLVQAGCSVHYTLRWWLGSSPRHVQLLE